MTSDWDTYDRAAAAYLPARPAVLEIGTYASHRPLDDAVPAQLHDELRRVIDTDLGGTVTEPYDCVLFLGTVERSAADDP